MDICRGSAAPLNRPTDELDWTRIPFCQLGQLYCGVMPAPVNCVWLKMLYISARNMSTRFSLFSGKDLENVMSQLSRRVWGRLMMLPGPAFPKHSMDRSEEHTSELQSLRHIVCRL